MKKLWILFGLMVLVACGGTAETETAVSGSDALGDPSTTSQDINNASAAVDVVAENGATELNEDYPDAVPVQMQLILGSLQLSDGVLAIDEGQANELLPLWRAMESLSQSDTTAAAEMTAVLNQIQNTMLPEQISAIVAMELTAEDTQTILQESGGFRLGGRGAAADGQTSNGGEGRPAGGLPGGGQGPGGGLGGPGGGLGGNVDPEAVQTRLAERFGEGVDPMAQLLMGTLIRNLEVTAGLVDADALQAGNGRNGFGAVMPLIAEETGLAVEDIQAQLQEGSTLADIITNNGGDVEAIQEALLSQFSQAENFDEEAARTQIDEMLNGGFGQPPVNE